MMSKAAVVTGAGRGIGRAIALRLAKDGMDIVVNSEHAENADRTVKEVEALGVSAIAFAGDVSEEKVVAGLMEATVKKFGKIDVMVANAGIAVTKTWEDTEVEDFDRVYAVNVRGVYLCDKYAMRQMLAQPDNAIYKIINCGSIASYKGFQYLGPYCCTKAAVRSMTQSLAQEVAPRITVNTYCPGVVDTDMWVEIDRDMSPYLGLEQGGAWEAFTKTIPMNRPEQPEDVANLVSFLASPQADYITGQAFITDGGLVFS